MYNLKSPDTPEQAIINRDKIDLLDSIQKAHNRIQYDRSLTDLQRNNLRLHMALLEMDYFNFYGTEVRND